MMNRSFLASMAFVGLYIVILSSTTTPTSAVPVRYMCDMCESTWLHCLMKCHMEDYMTRHKYENHVYVGEPAVKPKKNHLDMMFHHIMHSTGHDHM